MLGECLEVFGSYTEEERERRILDHYIPKDGSYILVGKNGEVISATDFKLDKKTGKINKSAVHFNEFCYYDYYSNLIVMQKYLSNKIIHSNNYLSFYIKKKNILNGGLTSEIITEYYDVLEHPEKKWGKGKQLSTYQKLEAEIGQIDIKVLQKNKEWILEHIFDMDKLGLNIDMSKKSKEDYLKIFFEAEKEEYQREGNRYFVSNIYNSNVYNIIVNDEILGLPVNNMNMNSKKPFLSVKTRKVVPSHLLNRDDAVLRKQFFDYLMNFAMAGKYNVYVDMEKKNITAFTDDEYPPDSVTGFYIRLQKGKEVEIRDQDVVPFFDNHLKKSFFYENKLRIEDEKNPEYEFGKTCTTYKEIEELINDIFFSKLLVKHYFSEEAEIKTGEEAVKRMLLLSRRKLFGWLHLGNAAGMKGLLDQISRELIKSSISNEYMVKAAKQLNLRLSLMQYFTEGGEDMADFSVELRENLKAKLCSEEYVGLESDKEYYFAVGQLARYFVYLNKTGKKKQSMINPFLNAGTDKKLKDLVGKYFKKYNYAIFVGAKRVSRLYGMIEGYEPQESVLQDMISAGFVIDNLLLEGKEKEEQEDE
ncbi:MAG: CRISPR-associated protein [Lachnospiraceae bacterium]|nr:CRISPR-associated protein [Lachnospiraceae bacterium]